MSNEKHLEDYKSLQNIKTPKVNIDREKKSVTVENATIRKDIQDFNERIKKLENQQRNFQKQVDNMGVILKKVVDFKKLITSKLPNIDANNS